MKVAEGLLPGVLKGIAEHLRMAYPVLASDADAVMQAADRIATLEADLAAAQAEILGLRNALMRATGDSPEHCRVYCELEGVKWDKTATKDSEDD